MVNDISGLTMTTVWPKSTPRMMPMRLSCTSKARREISGKPGLRRCHREIKAFLQERVEHAIRIGYRQGEDHRRPWHRFRKTRWRINLCILKMLREFKELGSPSWSALHEVVYRKDNRFPPRRKGRGTLATLAVALMNGADIIRVHDVKKAGKVLKIVKAVMESMIPIVTMAGHHRYPCRRFHHLSGLRPHKGDPGDTAPPGLVIVMFVFALAKRIRALHPELDIQQLHRLHRLCRHSHFPG